MVDDRIHKLFYNNFIKVLELSDISIINFINGVFNKDLSLNSVVVCCIDQDYKSYLNHNFLSYNIIIDGKNFSIEYKISKDNTITLIFFENNYYDAVSKFALEKNEVKVNFSCPKIIILEGDDISPDEYIIEATFGENNLIPFELKSPTIKFFNMSLEEINNNNLVIMIPFYLLKLRKEIAKNRSVENVLKLKLLINEGLINSILDNEKKGSITTEDKVILIEIIKEIYDQLYGDIDIFTDEKVTYELDRELVFEVDKINQVLNRIKFEKENAVKQMIADNISLEKIKLYLQVTDEQIEEIKKQMITK